MLNRTGPKIGPCGTPDTITSHRLYAIPYLLSIYVFEDSYALALKLKVKVHKHLVLQLIDHGKGSQLL